VFDIARIAASGLVARIDYHESLGSTSDRALALGSDGESALPLLVLTERQTAGRGRGSNRWWTTDGALTFSLLLEAPPDRLPAERWPQVALAAGIAVCDALQSQVPGPALHVKWPNDVFLSGRKVCGILSESIPGWRDRLVVGIGMNVNNRLAGSVGPEPKVQNPKLIPRDGLRPAAPDVGQEIAATATSLIDFDGVPRGLTEILIATLDQFDRRWRELLDDRFDLIAAAYRERCFLTSRSVTIEQAGGHSVAGVCAGINDSGALRLRTEAGEQVVVSGSVLFWDR
jgi:BirA family transcriptional regulator, biotin operon repressor / biotin---[acetyl-CoA-carboxylase] ligase